uniref:Acetyl-CoA carboxylase n=1 Tax=Rhabditophanes sp. KR3021 TaxID=114890 RepID=A0AC35UAX5_9BILA
MPDSPEINTHRTSYYSRGTSLSTQVNQHNETFASVEDFVRSFCADQSKARVIKKVLVATNGIAAVKCILSIRKLLMQLFKEDRIIKFICLTTSQEIESHAEYLKMADYVVLSPAGANTNNYANVDEIVEHAVANKVDAVWAGWGHASENPRLPKELAEKDIVFIGPPATAMFFLGDKIASTIIAQTVNIPTIEWSGSGLVADDLKDTENGFTISDELYKRACVSNAQEGLESLKRCNISYPVMIKASEGGGGKGIRKCSSDEEFIDNFRRVEGEVPGSPIFLMKCMMNARHIEVQLIGDMYGDVIPIFTRDCSIQRRCQKIIEEAPAGIAPKHVLRQMQQDAVNLAKKVGYVSAGTVEYMYLPETQKYYFLELNPRLQVEHPCTEMVANINIPAIQLQIAMGVPLRKIVEIRLFFGMDRYGDDPLPEDQIRTETNLCVIAARITSEDPAEGFRPASGAVEVLNFQSNQNVWGYFSISSTGQVHEYADSQFGHLFAKGTTRQEAISNMLCALNELEIRATFASQVRYMEGLLREEDFEQNRFNTGWLDARIAAKVHNQTVLPHHVNIAIGATVIGHAKIEKEFSKFQKSIERGQVLPTKDLTETWQMELVHSNTKYSVLVNRNGPLNYVVYLNGSQCRTEVRIFGNSTLLVTYSDQSYACYLEEESERYTVTIGRTAVNFEKENDPSVLRSANAGRLTNFLKKDGEVVRVGDIFAEMESMKMIITLDVKKAGGRLIQVARVGQALFPGTLIAKLEDQGNMTVQKPTDFVGRMEEWDKIEQSRASTLLRLDTRFEKVLQYCKHVLNGYSVAETMLESEIKKLIDSLLSVLNDENLPRSLFNAVLSTVSTRIPQATYKEIHAVVEQGRKNKTFNATDLYDIMTRYLCTVDPKNIGIEKTNFEALMKICERFEGGLNGHIEIVVKDLLTAFLNTENYFQDVAYDRAVSQIKTDMNDANISVRMIYSHTRIHAKNTLLIELIKRLDTSIVSGMYSTLKTISNLYNPEVQSLAIFVREKLNSLHRVENKQVSLTDFDESQNDAPQELLPQLFFSPSGINANCIQLYIEKSFCFNRHDVTVSHLDENIGLFSFEISPNNSLYQYIPKKANTTSFTYGLVAVSNANELTKSTTIIQQTFANVNNIFFVLNNPNNNIDIERAKNIIKDITENFDISDENCKFGEIMIVNGAETIFSGHHFGLFEKLQLYRLNNNSVNISHSKSPFILYKKNDNDVSRYFVRCLLKNLDKPHDAKNITFNESLKLRIIDAIDCACGEIRVSYFNSKSKGTIDCNQIYLAVDSYPNVTTSNWIALFEDALKQCEYQLTKNRITEVELTFNELANVGKSESNNNLGALLNSKWETFKVVYSNETGAIPEITSYKIVNGLLKPMTDSTDKIGNLSFYSSHSPIGTVNVQKKRLIASKLNTTFVYDLPLVFGRAVLKLWDEYSKSDPEQYKNVVSKYLSQRQKVALISGDASAFVQAYEMILEEDNSFYVCRDEQKLKERAANALNNRGMVAWEVQIYTPEAPLKGKKIVIIANDITYVMGSFSMREHNMYYEASKYSRRHQYPRVYVSANSGARIGLANDVKKKLSVNWKNQNDPEEGFCCLSVENTGEGDDIFNQVRCSHSHDDHLSLDAVIGKETDIGVENLVGSGLIAGETSAAYKEVPTYCLVTGRAVGIGAYAARLCHRICQVESSHIILTGAPALNSLLGKEVYACNNQLGGPQIMYNNGVSHTIVTNDLEGCAAILRWIAYLPSEELPLYMPMAKDDGSRDVTFKPTKTPYDPRKMLDNLFEDGLFDRGSFDEIMNAWAKTIIVGRARLRGLAVGVVATETRTVECEIPADPATENSESQVISQAGQVWYPDSAYKTSEAINDFNKEGLPLILIANIRGFSGGQKDMFEMVLKFGANIVDALQAYTQPVIVYIPPWAELRGGSWAVVDTKINPNCISMFADTNARGGVLEPEAIVKIKFRQHDLVILMNKLDSLLKSLQKEFDDVNTVESRKVELKKLILTRKNLLLPIYESIAAKFADLHDTTTRLLARDAIKDEVPLEWARDYFYEVLRSELAVNHMAKQYLECKNVLKADITINKLNEAYEWLRNLLEIENIHYIHKTGKEVNNRLTYDSNVILNFASSDKFKSLLSKAKCDDLSSLFERNIKYLDHSSRNQVFSNILSSADMETQNEMVVQHFSNMSASAIESLLAQLKTLVPK